MHDVHQAITLSRIGATIFNDILKDTNKRYFDPETYRYSVGMSTHWIRKIKGPPWGSKHPDVRVLRRCSTFTHLVQHLRHDADDGGA